MSWLFGKNSGNATSIPATTPLQQQRLKQIKSLSNHNKNVTEIQRDVAYKVTFQSDSKEWSLLIHLSPGFPHEKPFVVISPSCYHQWVDKNNMEVKGSTELNQFYMHSDLGKVIQHIVKEFKKNPPTLKQPIPLPNYAPLYQRPPYTQPLGNPSLPPVTSTAMSSNLGVSTNEPPSYASPAPGSMFNSEKSKEDDISLIVKEMADLPKEELEKICNNPDMLIDRILKMESVEKLKEERKTIIEKNEEIANSSLELEPVIDDLKGDLKETFEEYNELYYAFQEKSRKQDELSQIFDLGNILMNMRIAVMQGEEESEKIAEDFMSGSVNLDSFLTSYIEKRKVYHMRRANEERIKCIVPQY